MNAYRKIARTSALPTITNLLAGSRLTVEEDLSECTTLRDLCVAIQGQLADSQWSVRWIVMRIWMIKLMIVLMIKKEMH